MRRDRRLLIAIMLFLVSLIALTVQAWIVRVYIFHAVMGGWEPFIEFFGAEGPVSGPDEFCFDYCVPDLPFAAGWIGIAAFLFGWIVLVYAWWKPKA